MFNKIDSCRATLQKLFCHCIFLQWLNGVPQASNEWPMSLMPPVNNNLVVSRFSHGYVQLRLRRSISKAFKCYERQVHSGALLICENLQPGVGTYWYISCYCGTSMENQRYERAMLAMAESFSHLNQPHPFFILYFMYWAIKKLLSSIFN